MGIDRVMVIAQNPAIVARLLPLLHRAGFSIDAMSAPGSRLGYSKYVHRYQDLSGNDRTRTGQLRQVASGATESDWVILGTDEDLGLVADEAERHPDLLRLLPVDSRNIAAVYSKVGTASLLERMDVSHPRFAVAPTTHDVPAAVTKIGLPAIVKPDRGAEGRGAVVFTVPGEFRELPSADAPFIIEEFIHGDLMSIDLFVVNGKVAMAPYSRAVSTMGPFGVTIRRRYFPLKDEQLRADLSRIAAGFGGLWFGNVSAIRRPDGSHEVFEVDLRPNVWHAYLERLGYPLLAALRGVRLGTPLWPLEEPRADSLAVVNVTRALKAAVELDPRHATALAGPAAWRYAHRGDPRLSQREGRDFARWLVLRNRGKR